ncbi:hypothetical protein A3Q56_03176 [Intoshia linei]|uniref:Uncharacterized protein n=1 Tax=Intoshia linei TaxID=1819745 RepID=A0A177B613_9BILA|nr:hypothetical protein A3Q56_03176 [Intoshia linei]
MKDDKAVQFYEIFLKMHSLNSQNSIDEKIKYINIYCRIIKFFSTINTKRSLTIIEYTKSVANTEPVSYKELAKLHLVEGNINKKLNNYKDALSCFRKALTNCIKWNDSRENKLCCKIHDNIAELSFVSADSDFEKQNAIDAILENLNYKENIYGTTSLNIAKYCKIIALFYLSLQKPLKAKPLLERSKKLYTNCNKNHSEVIEINMMLNDNFIFPNIEKNKN